MNVQTGDKDDLYLMTNTLLRRLQLKLMWLLSLIMKKLTDLDMSDISDKKKNNFDNRLMSLHHCLWLYIVNSHVGKCDRPDIPCFSFIDVQENRIQK